MAMIKVQLAPDAPITELDECDLVKTVETISNDVEDTTVTLYHLKTQPDAEWAVHRSVDMKLKIPAVFADGGVAGFF